MTSQFAVLSSMVSTPTIPETSGSTASEDFPCLRFSLFRTPKLVGANVTSRKTDIASRELAYTILQRVNGLRAHVLETYAWQ